jgi:hypothetical protein
MNTEKLSIQCWSFSYVISSCSFLVSNTNSTQSHGGGELLRSNRETGGLLKAALCVNCECIPVEYCECVKIWWLVRGWSLKDLPSVIRPRMTMLSKRQISRLLAFRDLDDMVKNESEPRQLSL